MPKSNKNTKQFKDVLHSNSVFEIDLQQNEQTDSAEISGNITLKSFPVSPAVDITGLDGRSYRINANSVIDTQKQRKTDIPIYVRHNYWEGAYGWIKTDTLTHTNNQLTANIEFNTKGSELIRNKEFRYLSPTYIAPETSANTYEVLSIYEVSLVNHPNLLSDAMSNCADCEHDDKDTDNNPDLPTNNHSNNNNNNGENMSKELQDRIDDLEKQNKALTEKNEAQQKALTEADAKRREMLISNAVENGQLAPAKKDFALSLNEQQLNTFLDTEKGVMDSLKQPIDIEQNRQENTEQLSAEQKQINAQLGIE